MLLGRFSHGSIEASVRDHDELCPALIPSGDGRGQSLGPNDVIEYGILNGDLRTGIPHGTVSTLNESVAVTAGGFRIGSDEAETGKAHFH